MALLRSSTPPQVMSPKGSSSTGCWSIHKIKKIDDQDDVEEIGVKPLSYSQSLIHSAYDSAESIATPPDSDLEDEQLRKMLASPLFSHGREENEGQPRAYHTERKSMISILLTILKYQGNLVRSVYRSEKHMHNEHKLITQDEKV